MKIYQERFKITNNNREGKIEKKSESKYNSKELNVYM